MSALRRVLWVWLVIAVVCALYWPTTLSYSVAWTDFDNKGSTHGYIIAVMCLALIYLRRKELALPTPQTTPHVNVALALASVVWLIVLRAGLQTAHQLLLPLIIWLAIAAICGLKIARACSFAVAYLYFALPFWGFINGALQTLTILATHVILSTIGLPVRFYGNLVQIPEGMFAIEDGCSGLHFMVVALAIAAYYGELHRDTVRHRFMLLGIAAVLALLTNWIRVSVIIVAGHLTDMQSYLVRVSHYGFGWAAFAVAMTVFFIVAARIPASSAAPPTSPERATGAVAPRVFGWVLAPAVAALILGPVVTAFAMRGDARATVKHSAVPQVPGWTGPLIESSSWQPIFKGADREVRVAYRRGTSSVEWYTAEYAFQHQGRKLLGYDNSLLGASDFTVLEQGVASEGSTRFVSLLLRDSNGVQSLLWYFYKIGSRAMTSGIRAQLWYGLTSLMRPVDSQIVAFRAKCEPDCMAARAQLRSFVAGICDSTSRFDNCRRDP